MRYSIFIATCFAAVGLAQNCGPAFGNQKCAAGNCCSQYGWVSRIPPPTMDRAILSCQLLNLPMGKPQFTPPDSTITDPYPPFSNSVTPPPPTATPKPAKRPSPAPAPAVLFVHLLLLLLPLLLQPTATEKKPLLLCRQILFRILILLE
ncbi:MAG: hypothetical protein Q9200_003362 [Gallowayella weberi]